MTVARDVKKSSKESGMLLDVASNQSMRSAALWLKMGLTGMSKRTSFFDLIGNFLYYEDTIVTATEEAKKSFPDCPVSYMAQLTRQNPSTALLATQHVISYNVRWHGPKLRMWTSLLTQLVKPFLTPTGATLQTQLQTMAAATSCGAVRPARLRARQTYRASAVVP